MIGVDYDFYGLHYALKLQAGVIKIYQQVISSFLINYIINYVIMCFRVSQLLCVHRGKVINGNSFSIPFEFE